MPPPTSTLPHVEPGLLMANIDRVLVVYMGGQLDEGTYRRHVEMLAREIDARPVGRRVAVLYDCPQAASITARQRKELAEMLKRREERLRRTTAAYALATPSMMARGILRAVFWVAPPPYPHEVVNTSAEAFHFFRRHLPEIDPEVYERQYRQLLAAHPRALDKSA